MSEKKNIALYPGTFDPITYGHLDLIKRSIRIFDRLVVLVAVNPQKQPLFTAEERLDMIQETTRSWEQVTVDRFDGMLVDYVRKNGIYTMIRGLRALTDFEIEFQRALTNRRLEPKLESMFLMTSSEYLYLSATLVREVAQLGTEEELGTFVPPYVVKRLRGKFQS